MFLATRAGVPWTVLVFAIWASPCARAARGGQPCGGSQDRCRDGADPQAAAGARWVSRSRRWRFAVSGGGGAWRCVAFTNPLAAATLASLLGYAVIYTASQAWTRRIVIGAWPVPRRRCLGWVCRHRSHQRRTAAAGAVIFAWTRRTSGRWPSTAKRNSQGRHPMLPVTTASSTPR